MRTALPGEINHGYVDRYTLPHVAVGMGYAYVGWPFWLAALLGIGWELLERPARVRGVLRKFKPEAYSYQDTAENALVDALAVMAGWYVGDQIRKRQAQGRP